MGVNGRDKDKEEKPRRRPGRVPTSCAECRRLKLRCDRNVPCEKCVSRGCGSICPDGCLTAGKGNRLILANTEELHDRIDHLCARIRELEDALRTLQAIVSDRPHPLLQSDSLLSKSPLAASSSVPTRSSTASQTSQPAISPPASLSPDGHAQKSEDESLIDAFGTLTIGMRGEANFLGQTARSEYLIHALSRPRSLPPVTFPRLSQRMIDASFLENTAALDLSLRQEVLQLLPPHTEAIRLCEMYLEYGQFIISPMTRTELFDEVLNVVYKPESSDPLQFDHALSLLFVAFAIACLLDPAQPPFSIDAHEFYLLSRLALNFSSPVSETTLIVIQTLMHISQYLELSDWEPLGSNVPWVYIGLATRLAHSIGLHLNSARWNLNTDICQRRSRIFWQLFLLDTWMSFSFGRPPSIFTGFVDCEFPKDNEEIVNQDGQLEIGFHPWSWRYAALLQSIMSTAFVPSPPAYLSILELDRKIRDFPVPLYLRPHCEVDELPPPPQAWHMQRWWVLSCKETTLLNLHRSYFTQALHDKPPDLLKHKYGPSVLATYRSAWRIIEGLRMSWKVVPQLLARISLAWSQALSSAIVMCLLVTRAPASHLTTSSLDELDRAVTIFEEAAPTCRAAASSLDAIRSLRKRAREAVDHSHQQETTSISPTELDRLGGKTHLIAAPNPRSYTPTSRSSSFTLTENAEPSGYYTPSSMHPTIIQDMRNFDLGAPVYNNMFDFPTHSPSHPQPMADVQFLDNLFAAPSLSMSSVNVCQMPYQPSPLPFNPCPPVLDATWQSFVEQLGF